MGLILLIIGGIVVLKRIKLPVGSPVTPFSAQPAGQSFSVREDVSAADGQESAPTGNTSPLAAFFGSLKTILPAVAPPAQSGPGGATVDPGKSPAPAGEAQNLLSPSAPETTPTELQAQPGLLADPSYWYMEIPMEIVIAQVGETQAMNDQDVLSATGDYFDALTRQLKG